MLMSYQLEGKYSVLTDFLHVNFKDGVVLSEEETLMWINSLFCAISDVRLFIAPIGCPAFTISFSVYCLVQDIDFHFFIIRFQ